MAKWRNFYIRKKGVGSIVYPTYESVSQWGVWCKDIPFIIFGKVKEPAKNSWFDEHGDDEYIPSDGLNLESYTMKVEFGCKKMRSITDGDVNIDEVTDVRNKVNSFLQYLRTSGMLDVYSTHTRIGRTNVRLVEVSDSAKWKSDGDEEYLVFSVVFKVNDPITDVVLGQD